MNVNFEWPALVRGGVDWFIFGYFERIYGIYSNVICGKYFSFYLGKKQRVSVELLK